MTFCPECYKRGYSEGKEGKGDWDAYRPPIAKDEKRCPKIRESFNHLTAYEQGFWDGAGNREPQFS